MKTVEIKNLTKSKALSLIGTGEIVLYEGKLYSKEDYDKYKENTSLSEYYDMLQGVRKVLLNSSYGATLNEWCRFHDPRLGASTTGSGRQITTFMLETITEQLVGYKIPLVKVTEETEDGEFENAYTIECPPGLGPVMADTDSCYFLMDALLKDITDEAEKTEMAVQIADAIVADINEKFNKFTPLAFNCQPDFVGKIEAAREIVASAGIIRAKKNYTFLVKDNEGKRYTTDKLKFQGGDLKVKTTPEVIRKFLEGMTMRILKGVPRTEIEKDIITFRDTIGDDVEKNPLAYGTVYTVKNLDINQEKWRRTEKVGLGKVKLTGHDRAAINYNYCLEMFSPNETQIIGGGKVKIICLMDNEYGFKTIGFPSEFEKLPEWFTKRFSIDLKLTEMKMVDGKVGNTFIPMGWEVPTRKSVLRNSLFEF